LFLEVEKLTKSFGGLMAINDLCLSIHEGEILGLIGPNGSGKTTLFSLITGFLRPDSGAIYFRGREITGLKPHSICERGIVRTFQLVRPFAKMTALENVMVGRVYGRIPAKSLTRATVESRQILDFVGLGSKRDTVAGSLTLSERKKLELARALAGRPHLLLLDELTAGLNPVEAEAAIRLIQAIKKLGVTVIMVEHNVKVVLRVSSKVVVIGFGEKIAEGAPQEVIRNKRVVEAYLGNM
jgi:branched-chain amino acid transport system ATP-binding protein